MHYLEALLASASIYASDNIFHIVLVNVDPIKSEYLKKLYKDIIIENEYINFNNIESLRAYCANRRTSLIPSLMDEYKFPIVWIDADSLFTNRAIDFTEFASTYEVSVEYNYNHDVLSLGKKKLKKYPKGPFGTPYYGVLSTGVITTNNTSSAKSFFNDYMNKTAEKLYEWYADQEGLYLLLQEYHKNINFAALQNKYCSRFHNEDTVIWTLKGATRESNEYYKLAESHLQSINRWDLKNVDIPQKRGKSILLDKRIHLFIKKIRNKIGRIIIVAD